MEKKLNEILNKLQWRRFGDIDSIKKDLLKNNDIYSVRLVDEYNKELIESGVDNNLIGQIKLSSGEEYDVEMYYLKDNGGNYLITEIELLEQIENEECNINLQFADELTKILDIYTEEEWSKEPLDSDEVEILVKHLKNQLDLINGNITNDEYKKLENF